MHTNTWQFSACHSHALSGDCEARLHRASAPNPPSGETVMAKTAIQESVEQLYAQGRLAEALQILAEALGKQESSSLWNDWGVVQIALAERAFRRALELEPANDGTAANLAVLLYSEGRSAEAVPLLQQALAHAEGIPRTHIAAILAQCESAISPAPATTAAPG